MAQHGEAAVQTVAQFQSGLTLKDRGASGSRPAQSMGRGAEEMNPTTIGMYADMVNILVAITVLMGALWAVYKFVQYRELKQRIQLDIDANMYRLASPEQAEAFSWDRQGNRVTVPAQPRTHAVEILLKFTNGGFTRMRLFNIQVGVNTMRPQNEAQFDQDDGHLHLTRIFTSGNIVPIFRVNDRPVEETSFYYIEPGIEQTISYLTLITEPREVVQIYAKFSLEQERLFPTREVGAKGIYPHTAARSYKVNSDGSFVK
jgi:hypothetical protein